MVAEGYSSAGDANLLRQRQAYQAQQASHHGFVDDHQQPQQHRPKQDYQTHQSHLHHQQMHQQQQQQQQYEPVDEYAPPVRLYPEEDYISLYADPFVDMYFVKKEEMRYTSYTNNAIRLITLDYGSHKSKHYFRGIDKIRQSFQDSRMDYMAISNTYKSYVTDFNFVLIVSGQCVVGGRQALFNTIMISQQFSDCSQLIDVEQLEITFKTTNDTIDNQTKSMNFSRENNSVNHCNQMPNDQVMLYRNQPQDHYVNGTHQMSQRNQNQENNMNESVSSYPQKKYVTSQGSQVIKDTDGNSLIKYSKTESSYETNGNGVLNSHKLLTSEQFQYTQNRANAGKKSNSPSIINSDVSSTSNSRTMQHSELPHVENATIKSSGNYSQKLLDSQHSRARSSTMQTSSSNFASMKPPIAIQDGSKITQDRKNDISVSNSNRSSGSEPVFNTNTKQNYSQGQFSVPRQRINNMTSQQQQQSRPQKQNSAIHVSNIPMDSTEDMLKNCFERFAVTKAILNKTNPSIGTVVFASVQERDKVLKLSDQFSINNQVLGMQVKRTTAYPYRNFNQPNRQRQPSSMNGPRVGNDLSNTNPLSHGSTTNSSIETPNSANNQNASFSTENSSSAKELGSGSKASTKAKLNVNKP